jgi:hypothetical protein
MRAPLLPARVEIALAAHDLADAREAADELAGIARTFDQPVLHAAAHQALGASLTYEEDAAAATAELRRAVRHWTDADAPFEAAQARRWLAVAYRSGGDEEAAALELRAARTAFERLGATLEADRCEEMLRAGVGGLAGRQVTRTFMFTDIVGSTELVRTMGDEAWEVVLRWHDETLRTLIGTHRGEVVHTTRGRLLRLVPQRGGGRGERGGDPAAPGRAPTQARLRAPGPDWAARGRGHRDRRRLRRPRRARGRTRRCARRGRGDPGDHRDGLERPDGVPDRERADVELKGLADPVPLVSIDWS